MRSYCLLFLLALLSILDAFGQDFSNKGKDFWVGYGYHVRYTSGNPINGQDMVLYFATEAVTNVTVSIPALGYTQTYNNIPANTIFTTNPLPKAGAQDARLTTEGVSNKGVHITSDKPIVAYAHIYSGNVSGATLLFPTPTLGREYFSVNFQQHSNEANSNCFFYAVATDTGTTTIEVVPSANTQTMVAGQTYTFNLTQGQIFNALGTTLGNDGVDLTGTRIRSISTGANGCKRIAVFSGSGKLNIKCAPGASGSSADNYMVQAFPKNAWGKSFLTAPTQQMTNNFFRIAVSDPTTVVRVNGTIQTNLINSFYYQIGQTNQPNLIVADKPIMVAQYITSANVCGNTAIGGQGDPEVIYLSPVEQNIDKVILNSTPNFAISSQYHYVNVVIPNGGTGISSFRIDGAPASGTFVTHPQNPAYSYLIQNVTPGQHTLQSDSGFNAIAYGYGAAESYGYNAGANVKDLYQFVSVQNQYATVNFPAACKSSPFYFSIVFPYQPTQIKWHFNGLFADVVVNGPVHDSTWVVNGRQLYRYKLTTPYTINTVGTYPIRIVAQNPTPEGCSGEQEVNYDLQVFERPVADFNFTTSGCISDSVRFTDAANTNGRPAIRWSWDFNGQGTSNVRNPVFLFNTPGSHPVRYSVITDIGCLSDTVTKTVVLSNPPVAKFGVSTPNCANRTISFTDSSAAPSGSIVKWTWNFGDSPANLVATTNAPQVHTYATPGTYTVTLRVESSTGCLSQVFSRIVTVSPNPVPGFNFGNACLPQGTMNFTNTSTISNGTEGQFTYQWNFGDGTGTSTQKDPTYNYGSTGPFNVTLVVTSNAGCVDSLSRSVNTVYAQPQAGFTAPAEVCLNTPVVFTDQSAAANSTITQWQWNFGDNTSSTEQNPTKNYAAPGTYTVTLTATSAIGCVSTVATRTVTVNPLPTANFTHSVPGCETRLVTFTDASSVSSGSITQWSWNLGNGSSPVMNTNTPFTHTYAAAGTYTVTLQTRSDKGCLSPVMTRQLVINPVPVAGFAMPNNCLSDPFSQFTDTSSIADGSQGGFTYLWNFGDPNATPANPNTSTLQNPKHKFSVVGPYNVTLIVTSNAGCADTLTQSFFMNGTQPQSVFSLNSNPVCSNNTVSITDNSQVDVGSVVKLEIYWDYANAPTARQTINQPLAGAVYTFTYPEFYTPVSKDYVIRVVAYSGDSCYHETSRTITMKATPQVVFSPLTGVCLDVTPFALTQGGVSNGLPGAGVYTGNGMAGGLFDPRTAGVGTHPIRYTYTGTNGCTNFQEQTITVFPLPTVNAGPDLFVLEGGNKQLLATGTGSGLTWQWTPATYLNNPAIQQPVTTPTDDITYSLKLTTADGCTASDQVVVKVLKAPLIPNTFSPNGDGIHDRWEIKFLETYPGATVEIFNRYGQPVYKSTNYPQPWDGTMNGKALPAGTYYYIINPKNGRKQIAGYVDIIR